jgi:hypothetical protein
MLSSLLLAVSLCAVGDAEPRVLERILAIVDGRPVLLSDVRVVEALKGVTRREAVDALVDENLMLREAAQVPQSEPASDEIRSALEALLAAWPEHAGSVPDGALREAARRQLRIVKYIEFRFRAKARVDDAAVREAYDAASPGGGEAAYQAAAPGVRERLERRRLDEEVEAWVKELRSAAEIRYNPEAAPPE